MQASRASCAACRVTLLGSHVPAAGGRQACLRFHAAHLNQRHSPSCLDLFSRSEAPKKGPFCALCPPDTVEVANEGALYFSQQGLLIRARMEEKRSVFHCPEKNHPARLAAQRNVPTRLAADSGADTPETTSSPSSLLPVHLYGRTTIITAIHHFHFCLSLISSHV